jgi:hypothetical protein
MRTLFNTTGNRGPISALILFVACLCSCHPDDPKPVNEEEVITTIRITLTPAVGTRPVNLVFFDADGEQGNIQPEITVSGALQASMMYSAVITLKNETVNPPIDVSAEISEEGDDHLFCFTSGSNISIDYSDDDTNGLPIGLKSAWETGQAGAAAVTVALRHQPETKTGDCPGSGETDVEVTFNVTVE